MRIFKSTRFAFVAILALGLAGCDEADTPPKPAFVPSIKGEFYAEANLDGGVLLLSEGQSNYISTTGASELASGTGCWQQQEIVLKKETSDVNSLRITFLKKFETCPTQCAELESMFQKGKYAFGKTAAVTGKEPVAGVVVTFTDAEGTVWSSDKGNARQQGSTFLINAFDNNPTGGGPSKITEAKFNCVLYDNTGRQVRLTNGEIKSRSLDCSNL